MLALAHFRSKAAGLPDFINYASLIDEGVIKGKDGSLMAGFFFRGDDAASATASDRNYLTAMVNQNISRFGAGWAIWTDASRIDSPGYPKPEESHFPEPITAMIDAERRESFETQSALFESEYALIVQYLPPTLRDSKLAEMVYDDDGLDHSDPTGRIVAEFKKRLDDLQTALGNLLHMRRMGTIRIDQSIGEGASEVDDSYDSDELVNYLHYCLTNEPIALRTPDCPMYLDAWLGYPALWPGDTPKVGEKFVSCVAIEGFPGASYPGILDMLDSLPMAYRWSSRFIFLEQHEAVSALNRYRLKWQQKIRGLWSQVMKSQKGMINTDALLMKEQAEIAMNDARSGLVAYGYYTPVIVLMHENRSFLAEQARYVKTEIERKGFAARVETVNAVEAWLGTLPGHTYPNVRRPLVHTLNLADLLPLASLWPGLRECPCDLYPEESPPLMHTVTTGATPFRLNLHVGDVGHTLIFGPTGAGKSTLLAILQAQFRRYRSRRRRNGSRARATITAFDKGRSIYALCKATGGVHYDIGNDESETPALAPLADIDSESDALWAEEWIATCFHLQAKVPPSPPQKVAIHKAMNLLREAPRNERSLTNYVSTVQDPTVRDALTHYTLDGSTGHLLDGVEDLLKPSDYTVYEIDDLMKMGSDNAIPVLLYLFRRFERSLKGQPAMLSLDEAWVMLGHPVFAPKIREWLKELRKKNCLVIMATQSLSDAVNSGLLDVLIEQCPTKILLPNKEADLRGPKDGPPGPADLYQMFGLNSKEIQILKLGRYKQDYYYKSPLGRRVFELGLGPLALAFVAVSDKEDLAEVRHMIADHGDNWPLYWLDHKGVDYERYIARKAA